MADISASVGSPRSSQATPEETTQRTRSTELSVVPESIRKFSPADLMDTFGCAAPATLHCAGQQGDQPGKFHPLTLPPELDKQFKAFYQAVRTEIEAEVRAALCSTQAPFPNARNGIFGLQ